MKATGPMASASAIRGSSNSNLTIINLEYATGTCDKVVQAVTGETRIRGLLITAGTVTRGLEVTTAGTGVKVDTYAIAAGATVTRGLHVADTSTVDGSNFGLDGPTTAVHIANSGPTVELISCILHGSTNDLEIAAGAATGTLNFIACNMRGDQITFPAGYLETATVVLSFQDDKEGDEAFRIVGELSTGTPERGSEAVFGQGDSYTRGMVVLNYTGATGATDGTFNADVSAAAASATGSTFGFPSGVSGDAIVWGSSLEDSADTLKYWGLKMKQTTAMSSDGVVIWEIWDGATWAEINVLDVESVELYRYANDVFRRANSSEQIRYGITSDTTWASKTLNGDNLFWARVRITSSPTTAPVFEQSKLHTSRFEANADGTTEFFGTARFRDTLTVSGNAFGESGGITALTVAVGSGGIPTGWNQQNKNSLLNGNGDAIMTQYTLERGVDTGHPLFLILTYISSASSANTNMIGSLIPMEVSGVLVADPAGGVVPTARTVANTETLTAKAAQTDTVNGIATTAGKLHKITFGPFDISDYYEGDIVIVRIELDDDGAGNTNIGIFTLELNGVEWTPGERL